MRLAFLDAPANDRCACDRAGDTRLSVDAAIALAAAGVAPIADVELLALDAAAGRVLARSVHARHSSPAFDRAAMDGYALRAGAGLPAGTRLAVVGRIAAGARGTRLGPGEAARIFTGAPIPPGADAVVMQEDVLREGETVVLAGKAVAGSHIRPIGEDVERGDLVADAGDRLDPRRIALLAAQGIARVAVRRRTRVAVLSTGDELAGPGDALAPASIHDANRPMLLAMLSALGCETVDAGIAGDDADEQAARLAALADQCDLVVTSGGASVGEEDHAARALRLAGGSGCTVAMALKPGKPALLGRIGTTATLGLPGNPVAALVVFSLLGRAMLARLSGASPRRPAGLPVPLAAPLVRKAGRTEFVPARVAREGGSARLVLLSSNAARLRPLVEAEGFAELQADVASADAGTPVAFHAFDGLFS